MVGLEVASSMSLCISDLLLIGHLEMTKTVSEFKATEKRNSAMGGGVQEVSGYPPTSDRNANYHS